MSRNVIGDLNNPVRSSVAKFIPELKHVNINESKIESVAAELATDEFKLPNWRLPVFPDESEPKYDENDIIDFLFVGNSINFAFRDFESGEKFSTEYKGQKWSGAFGMWACLKREYDHNPDLLSGDYLKQLSKKDLHRIFGSSNGIEIPMFDDRHEILKEVGEILEKKYNGRFHNLINFADQRLYSDGDGIVDLLVSDFPSFYDSSTIKSNGESIEVKFFKRAQLAPGMAFGRFKDSGVFSIQDPENFTVFVDYNLPNVLRSLDILEYDESLSSKIESEELIEPDSRKEVEIRSATLYATDELLKYLNQAKESKVYGPHLDAKLFFMRDGIKTPVHKTRTTAY